MDYVKTNTNELYHHGVLGMKWGVRRYQNADGSYTKKGLERYKKSYDAYESAKQAHKVSKTNDTAVAKRAARRDLSLSKKALKRSVKIDRGHNLYREGYDTRDIRNVARAAHGAVSVLSGVGLILVNKYASTPTSHLNATRAVVLGSAACHAAITALKHKNLSDMRAYRNRYDKRD